IRGLGATSIEYKFLNAADFGGATTRLRFIMIIRFDGKPIVWPTPTHQKRDGKSALRPGMKPWRAAREIIDWSKKGKSILGRPIPLAPKALAR
ncbi:DNA cytosine methyltransferase, partial [Bacillus cereus group sp. Bce007]